jgi:hypothetical protein
MARERDDLGLVQRILQMGPNPVSLLQLKGHRVCLGAVWSDVRAADSWQYLHTLELFWNHS